MERQKALDILEKYTDHKNLIKHGLAVEAVMKYFAQLYQEDILWWRKCRTVTRCRL